MILEKENPYNLNLDIEEFNKIKKFLIIRNCLILKMKVSIKNYFYLWNAKIRDNPC